MKPKKTIIAVDLHGVLFKHNYKNMFKLFFKSKNKRKLIFALINPRLWIDVIKLMRKKAVAEEFFVGLAQKYHRLQPFLPLGITIANQQTVTPGMVEALVHLKKKGYELHLFSNIGSIVFEDLHKKYPNILALFDALKMPSQDNGYLRKPSKKAFEEYLKEHNPYGKKVIFIDDKKKNVEAATQHGIISILFHSMPQLKQELLLIGITSK